MDPTKIIAILTTVVGILASVIVFLFKRSDTRDKAAETERALMAKKEEAWLIKEQAWEAEREELRAEYAANARALSDSYAKMLREDRIESREREDAIRQEFIEVMERSAHEAARASAETTKVLDKIYDRFLGPERRRGGY